MSIKINTRVRIVNAGSDTGRTGVTATGEGMWNGGTSADRVVLMDDTGERLVFEGWMLETVEPTSRPLTDVTVGETIHAHGVPFVITSGPESTPAHAVHSGACKSATWAVGTYRGPDLGSYADGNTLAPFVTRDGHEWTFQGRTDLARVWSYDGGATWHYSV